MSHTHQQASPNIIIVMADELRRDALGCYGDPNVQTPNIDALAAHGVMFDAAYSTCPVCVPARFTFMTGQPAHSRMIPAIGWRMSPAERTLADEFNDSGYETIYIGKWHLYGESITYTPNGDVDWVECTRHSRHTPVPRQHQGRWNRWLGFELCNDPYNTLYFEDDDPTPHKIEGYQTDGLFDLAFTEIQRAAVCRKPFCCVVSVEPPHFPFVAPHDIMTRWLERELQLPPNFGCRQDDPVHPHGQSFDSDTRKGIEENWRHYYGMIENLDHNVGRLSAFLQERQLHENTIVVFLSDHGETGGSHGLPMGGKLFPYEHSTGIPLIISDPSVDTLRGAVVREPVNMEDIFPTVLALAGNKPRDSMPGTDLTPLLRDATAGLSRPGVLLEFVHDPLRGAVFNTRMWRAFRSRRYKYTVIGPKQGGQPWQFFDLEDDPYELNNLVHKSDCAALVTEHHRLLREEMTRTGDHYTLLPVF